MTLEDEELCAERGHVIAEPPRTCHIGRVFFFSLFNGYVIVLHVREKVVLVHLIDLRHRRKKENFLYGYGCVCRPIFS